MKKIFEAFKSFLAKHPGLGFFIGILMLLISIPAIVLSNMGVFSVIPFAASLLFIVRMFTYTRGHLPGLTRDITFNKLKLEYSDEEEAEKRYREISINRAAIYLIIAIVGAVLWLVLELLAVFWV